MKGLHQTSVAEALSQEVSKIQDVETAFGSEVSVPSSTSPEGVVIGVLVAIRNDDRAPLVSYPRQSGARAVPARSIVDLHGVHIGNPVVLLFERADPDAPIVVGVLRDTTARPPSLDGVVELEADGERLVVSAKKQLVLRCGKASITLTAAGKVLIDGAYVSSRSSGVNRIKGGSVHLN